MSLNGSQLSSIAEALLDGYIPSSLAILLRTKFDARLDDISLGRNFEQIVHDVINWADRHNRVLELIEAAHESNPGNQKLANLYQESQHWSNLIPAEEGNPPYKGLDVFDVNDHHLFFGRDALIAELVERLHHQRFLPVVGASGSGKSSVVRAGLVATLQCKRPLPDGVELPQGSDQWPVHIIKPGVRPFHALAASLTHDNSSDLERLQLIEELAQDHRILDLRVQRILSDQPADRLLLVVDQFEELFTACRDQTVREQFVANLLTACQPDGQTIVVLTLRADFYAYCASIPKLPPALDANQKYIEPMTDAEMEQAILGPLEAEGWEMEDGLLKLLLEDVSGEPGALPLLQHALLETWQRRSGRTLTSAGYLESGRVQGAIAATAEQEFHKLDTEGQRIARTIFLRLTELGEGREDTRRRIDRSELYATGVEPEAVRAIVTKLATIRLIVTSQAQNVNDGGSNATEERIEVEVAHEALIRAWPRLRNWLDDDREGLRLHRRLAEDAREWEQTKDDGFLYRGIRLEAAQDWRKKSIGELNAIEQRFLDFSQQAVDEEMRVKDEEMLQKVEQERKLAEEQKRRVLIFRNATIIVLVLFLVATTTATLSFYLNRQLDEANSELITTNKNLDQTINQLNQTVDKVNTTNAALQSSLVEVQRKSSIARARELAIRSKEELNKSHYEPAILLAIESGKMYPVKEAFSAIREALAVPWRSHVIFDEIGATHASWSADESKILTRSYSGARLWSTDTGEVLGTFYGHRGKVFQALWNKDESRILTYSSDDFAKVWDADTGEALTIIEGHAGDIRFAKWSADETKILTLSNDDTVRVWNSITGEELVILDGLNGVSQATWNADGSKIVTIDRLWSPKVWDAETGQELASLDGHRRRVYQAEWNADGTKIVTCSGDHTARVWDAETGSELTILNGHTDRVSQAKWSSDESKLLTISYDHTARVWDTLTGQELGIMEGHTGEVISAQWSKDESMILTISKDKTASVWDTDTGQAISILDGHTGEVRSAIWSADESKVLTASSDRTARVWDVTTGQVISILEGHSGEVWSAKWSKDEVRILTLSSDRTARVWDTLTGQELGIIKGHVAGISQAIWNTDESKILTAGGSNGFARIWSEGKGQEFPIITGHVDSASDAKNARELDWLEINPYYVLRATWSSDESKVLTSSDDHTARVWDVATGRELVVFNGHTRGLSQAVWNADESKVLTSSVDRTARIWDANTGREIAKLEGHTDVVSGVALSADEDTIFTWSYDRTLRLWDATTYEQLNVLSGFGSPIWNTDKSKILTRNGSIAQVWKMETTEELSAFRGHTGTVLSATWNADESKILTSSTDGTVRVWDADSGKELTRLEGHSGPVNDAVWNADESKILTSGNDGTARLWNTETGQQLITLLGHTDKVSRAEWSIDENRILTIGNDHMARVWDSTSGEEVAVLDGHTDWVLHAEWSADGTKILTSSADRTVRVWYANMQKMTGAACDVAPRNFTWSEWNHYRNDSEQMYIPTCSDVLIPLDVVLGVKDVARREIVSGDVDSAVQRLWELNGWLKASGQFDTRGIEIESFLADVSASRDSSISITTPNSTSDNTSPLLSPLESPLATPIQ
ncbi:MAG: effector-associated domain EAD1-containing protein [Chloroflexota bacterium]